MASLSDIYLLPSNDCCVLMARTLVMQNMRSFYVRLEVMSYYASLLIRHYHCFLATICTARRQIRGLEMTQDNTCLLYAGHTIGIAAIH